MLSSISAQDVMQNLFNVPRSFYDSLFPYPDFFSTECFCREDTTASDLKSCVLISFIIFMNLVTTKFHYDDGVFLPFVFPCLLN